MKNYLFLKRLSLTLGVAWIVAGCSSTPYAGQQTRSIKALSAQDQRDLREGKGLGFAKAAELNGYPGPMHTLEHARELQLSSEQLGKTQALLISHKNTVKALGVELVEAERRLDTAFATREVTLETLERLTAEIGLLQAKIRSEHLKTHIEQTTYLSKEQIAQYSVLRGYAR
jgi:Heavy-metal resistance